MDFKSLITFQMIVKYGSFNRAAQEMNYAQSTVTMQMQKLESELGVSLLERGKEVTLTEAGRLFYDQSLEIVKRLERLQTSLADMKLGEAGHVRIGSTEPTASYRLPQVLKKFMSEYPNIRVSIEISSTPVLSDKILKGDIDFSVSTSPGIGSEFYFEPLLQEEFVVLMPEDHPLAEKESVMPEDLAGNRLLITASTCPYRRKLEIVMQEKGNIPLDTMEVGSMTALKFYVENGLGIALVPKLLVENEPKGTTFRTIEGSLISMTFGLLCKESAYPLPSAGKTLYAYLKRELSGAASG
ncbi:LysR family transcriptional regulator [Paenibacillus nanensis]|uniref:LysR family transcriptional regulator n=1 Tax=Paenibacillus nanensis TaxID=393251 RepID=A0A3A1UNL3_9BACL|nr:LysR family transcriptional regulator [Paenibacillus nanensis]RIX50119.1 LysR family transcriptional regulator [Paenibacillus nanensis]